MAFLYDNSLLNNTLIRIIFYKQGALRPTGIQLFDSLEQLLQ
jgi:hypothetical protein